MTAPRRLLTIGHSYVVTLNRHLAWELARAGERRFEVTVVAPRAFRGPRDLRAVALEPAPGEPARLVAVPAHLTRLGAGFLYGPALRGVLRGCAWDLVHLWEEPHALAAWQVARSAPAGATLAFYTFQSTPRRYPLPLACAERAVLARSAGWLASGPSVVSALLPRGYGRLPHRVAPLGVDLGTFRPDPAAGEAVRRALGWQAPGPPVIGFVGRFVPEKGLETLLAALDGLAEPWRALLVGAGELEPRVGAWAARHGDRVRVVTGAGHAAVPRHLAALDLLCVPSRTTPRWREQFGRVAVEAFACGVPVLASASGELPHVVGDAGELVAGDDAPAWTRALADLLASPARRIELRERGLLRARAYAWPEVARAQVGFFEELLQST